MSRDRQQMAYAGRCRRCGELCAVVMDLADSPTITAKHVAEFIIQGLMVERSPADVVRMEWLGCRCSQAITGPAQAGLWEGAEGVSDDGPGAAGRGAVDAGAGVGGVGGAAELVDAVGGPGAAAREAEAVDNS